MNMNPCPFHGQALLAPTPAAMVGLAAAAYVPQFEAAGKDGSTEEMRVKATSLILFNTVQILSFFLKDS